MNFASFYKITNPPPPLSPMSILLWTRSPAASYVVALQGCLPWTCSTASNNTRRNRDIPVVQHWEHVNHHFHIYDVLILQFFFFLNNRLWNMDFLVVAWDFAAMQLFIAVSESMQLAYVEWERKAENVFCTDVRLSGRVEHRWHVLWRGTRSVACLCEGTRL
jgi:hypothetical protein